MVEFKIIDNTVFVIKNGVITEKHKYRTRTWAEKKRKKLVNEFWK